MQNEARTLVPRAVGDSRTYPLSLLNSAGQAIGPQLDIPSVTTILKALPKELAWWGYKMGLTEGRRLAKVGSDPAGFNYLTAEDEDLYEEVKRMGREEGTVKTPLNTMESAGDRGTKIHDIAEQVFRDGVWPDPKFVDESQHGYVRALKRWYDRKIEGKNFEVVAVEVPLVSLSLYPYVYAGTCDLILKETLSVGPPLFHVIDFKTAKDIYESALLQSTAYGYAAQERGIIPAGADWIGHVVRFAPDGKYGTKTSPCVIDDFVDVYKVWLWLGRMGARASA